MPHIGWQSDDFPATDRVIKQWILGPPQYLFSPVRINSCAGHGWCTYMWECACVYACYPMKPSLTHRYPLCTPSTCRPLSPLPSPLCLPPRRFISPGCVLSTSRPPKCTAVSESPVVSIAWRCSSGAPSSCPTMMISFMEAAPVLYAQVQKKKKEKKFILLFIHFFVSFYLLCLFSCFKDQYHSTAVVEEDPLLK